MLSIGQIFDRYSDRAEEALLVLSRAYEESDCITEI